MIRNPIGIMVVLTLGLLASGCGSSESEPVPPVPVRVVTVQEASGEEGLRYSASVEPMAKVPLSFQAQARVESRGGFF